VCEGRTDEGRQRVRLSVNAFHVDLLTCACLQATVLDTRQEVVVKVVWPDADLDPEDAKKESPGQHRCAVRIFALRRACIFASNVLADDRSFL
jgi:hypothetical protein